MIFLSGRPEMFFVVSASIRGPSVMKCFPTDQKISRKKKKYSKRCVAPILKQKEALPSRTCSFFRSFERHVTYSNCGGEKETKIFPEMSRVRRQLSSNIIGLRWTKQVDKEISLTSLLTKAVSAPAGRFEVNYQLQDFVCPQLLTSRRRTEKMW